MSAKAIHAIVSFFAGVSFGLVWLKVFWNGTREVPTIVLAAPIAIAILGLGHWVAYDFAIGHWAGDSSLLQAVFNVAVASALLVRANATNGVTPTQ